MKKKLVFLGLVALIAICASFFASKKPDGLEFVTNFLRHP